MKLPRLHATVWATASTHFVVDAYGNLFAPLLPLLIERLDLSLKTVGALAMCFQLASSVSQLAFGTLADRWRPRVLLMAGPLLSVLVLSLVGTVSSTAMLAVVLLVGGLGGAAFHPPAAALVHTVSAGAHKGLAMATHISGGSLGFALAPLVFAPAVTALGPSRAWLVAVPGLIALSYTLTLIRRVEIPRGRGDQGWAALRPYRKPLAVLYVIVVLRTLAANSLAVFLPVVLARQQMGVTEASAAVSFYLFTSTVGGFLGGPLADRYGARRVIIWSLVSAVPFLVAGQFTSGWTLTVLVAIGGFLLQSTLPVNVTFGQQLAPVSAATVASLMMGFAWGVGSLLAPLVGVIGDAYGLQLALTLTSLMPLLAAVVALQLPERAPGPAAHEPNEPREPIAPGHEPSVVVSDERRSRGTL